MTTIYSFVSSSSSSSRFSPSFGSRDCSFFPCVGGGGAGAAAGAAAAAAAAAGLVFSVASFRPRHGKFW